MITPATAGLYNNAAKNWNMLKFRANLLTNLAKKKYYAEMSEGLAADIFLYMKEAFSTNSDFTSLGLSPGQFPVKRDPDTDELLSFLIIKDGSAVEDEVFKQLKRFNVWTLKNFRSDRVQGPFSCCAKCAEDIVLLKKTDDGFDAIQRETLVLDTKDYSDEVDGVDSDLLMHCFLCKAALPVRSM